MIILACGMNASHAYSSAVPERKVVFVSAVSDEFHKDDPLAPGSFDSYRICLKAELSAIGHQVIIQEEMSPGTTDLLATLDREVEKSDLIVHLIGDAAGQIPTAAELRRLRERHPDLLAREPELRRAVSAGEGISYTQWELYLAFHYAKPRLVFCATPQTVRAPKCRPASSDRATQQKHLDRVRVTGVHRAEFHDQNDIARQIIRSLMAEGIIVQNPALNARGGDVREARQIAGAITDKVAERLRKPDPRRVPHPSPAGGNVVADAYLAIAESLGLTEQAVAKVVEEDYYAKEAAIRTDHSPQRLMDLALASIAMADYPRAMQHSRQAANGFLQDMTGEGRWSFRVDARADAINALLMLSDAAKLCRRWDASLAALREGGALIDKAADPDYWASYHAMYGRALLDAGKYMDAAPVIDAVVGIRERMPGQQSEDLIEALVLRIQLHYHRAQIDAMAADAGRALRLAGQRVPPDLHVMSRCQNDLGRVYARQHRFSQAEECFRFCIATDEKLYGKEAPSTLTVRHNLAVTLDGLERFDEAEKLFRSVIASRTEQLGPESTDTLSSIHELAGCLRSQRRFAESESLYRSILPARARVLGDDHPDVLETCYHLAWCIHDQGRTAEALPIVRWLSGEISRVLGSSHPSAKDATSTLQLMENEARMLSK